MTLRGPIFVTGGRGQLGRAIVARANAAAVAVAVAEVDIRDAGAVEHALARISPAVVINCAAFTAVDRAEAEPELTYAVNRDGAGVVARACRARAIAVLHVSTDHVFDGAGELPYREDHATAAVNVYGASKAAGEREVHAAGGVVVRTSWLFGEGGPSFVHAIVRLARERPVVRGVADQHGCPTYAGDLAAALLGLAHRAAADAAAPLSATYHYCNAGATTRHGFASAIVDELRRHARIACARVEAIATADQPTPARRPAYSVLDTARIAALGIATPHWRDGMQRVVADAAGSA